MTAPPSSTTSNDVLSRTNVAKPTSPDERAGRGLGWVLLIALAVAVSIAISLAVQLQPERASRPTPECGGLYTECCAEWDDNWGPCIDDDCLDDPDRTRSRGHARGLFDAEENFADRRLPTNC